jgi:far upstream element-binding protein
VNLIGSREAAARAKDLIMEIVESDSKSAATKDRVPALRDPGREPGYGGGYGGAGGSGADKINDSIFVPSEAVGMIIGKGGETIKDMQATTGCKINVSPSSGPGEVEREIGLVGSRDAIAAAKRAIEDKVEAVVSISYYVLFIVLTLTGTKERWRWSWPNSRSPKRLRR